MNRLVALATVFAAIGLVASVPADAPGCGLAPHANERVAIASESAFIIWDEAARMEHFIRRATFESTGYDFGFLVPTPTRPQLGEADPTLFPELTGLTAPKVVHERREVTETIHFGCEPQSLSGVPGSAGGAPALTPIVLETRRVGDLDAAVLGFSEGAGDPAVAAKELLEWLKKNGYAVRRDLLDWVTVYARDRWVITAFKIASVPQGPGPRDDPDHPLAKKDDRQRPATLGSTAVRMSFPTDRPFYPYREPVGQRVEPSTGAPRFLRVFVAAKHRVAGKLGTGSTAWPAKTAWADTVAAPSRLSFLQRAKLRPDVAEFDWKITEFEDPSSPRMGTDEVYFEPSADQSAVARPPHVVFETVRVRVYPEWFAPVAVAGPFVLLIGGLLLVRVLRR